MVNEIDVEKLKPQFVVGDRLLIVKDFFYSSMRLRITAVHEWGVAAEDANEMRKCLSTPVQHCFGWPPLGAFIRTGKLEGYICEEVVC